MRKVCMVVVAALSFAGIGCDGATEPAKPAPVAKKEAVAKPPVPVPPPAKVATPAPTPPSPTVPSVVLGPPKETAAQLFPGKGKLWAIFRTSMGTMVVELLEHDAPVATANFVALADGRIDWRAPDGQIKHTRFYDGTIFHRVIPRFMIQAGDPTGTGRGGTGYRFDDEPQKILFDRPGLLAMANSGPNTNSSQFFLTEVPVAHLNGRHTIFGRIVDGVELVGKIARVRALPGNRPEKAVTIDRLDIVRARKQPKP